MFTQTVKFVVFSILLCTTTANIAMLPTSPRPRRTSTQYLKPIKNNNLPQGHSPIPDIDEMVPTEIPGEATTYDYRCQACGKFIKNGTCSLELVTIAE